MPLGVAPPIPATHLFHPIESLLEDFDVGGVTNFFARDLDPLFLERVFRWAVGLVEDAEDAGEWEVC